MSQGQDLRPGSRGRIDELRRRAEKGEPLWEGLPEGPAIHTSERTEDQAVFTKLKGKAREQRRQRK